MNLGAETNSPDSLPAWQCILQLDSAGAAFRGRWACKGRRMARPAPRRPPVSWTDRHPCLTLLGCRYLVQVKLMGFAGPFGFQKWVLA